MNDWDRMFKDASKYSDKKYDEPQADWVDLFELPDGYKKLMSESDDYGCYAADADGKIFLAKVNPEDERGFYEIHEGCSGIFENALITQTKLSSIKIPASVEIIPDGAFSNSGSWAEMERGITKAEIDSGNKKYFADETGVYERLENGKKLILYLKDTGKDDHVLNIAADIIEIGKNALYGKRIDRVIFDKNGYSYSFPDHAYFKEELLKSFGKNGKLYDFEEYDKFLLRNHFNQDRIRMICERLSQNYEISEEMRNSLFEHVSGSMDEVLKALAKDDGIDELKAMTEAGFFTEGNINEAIDILNHTDRREMLTYLMDYKNENLQTSEFDFSI